jgi:hypothetical protein
LRTPTARFARTAHRVRLAASAGVSQKHAFESQSIAIQTRKISAESKHPKANPVRIVGGNTNESKPTHCRPAQQRNACAKPTRLARSRRDFPFSQNSTGLRLPVHHPAQRNPPIKEKPCHATSTDS